MRIPDRDVYNHLWGDEMAKEPNGIFYEIQDELERATRKHGFEKTPMYFDMSLNDSFLILAEEFGEVAQALTKYWFGENGVEDTSNLEEELIQTAAMSIAMLYGIRDGNRRGKFVGNSA